MTGPETPRVLIVDDDSLVAESIQQWLSLTGFIAKVCGSADDALMMLRDCDAEAVLTDVRMPGLDGLELLRMLQTLDQTLPVVLLTGHGDVPMAVEALKAGAFDFLTKPYDPDRLVATLRNACRQRSLSRRIVALEMAGEQSDEVAQRLIGHSPAMQRLQSEVASLLHVPIDVLIRGETGAGKEVVARTIHELGPRSERPFVAINCAAIPHEMIESELFGHESGAFTGARQARVGKFEFANGGTIFLDEIESMPASAQAKVLRVLQERVVERIGSNRAIPVDIRVLSASKADLRLASEAGEFRSDLYFRLCGYELDIPALRDRGDDILLLFSRFASAMRRLAPELSPEMASELLAYPWPGNVRELRTVAERYGLGLGLQIGGARISAASAMSGGVALNDLLDAYERKLIIAALKQANGASAEATQILKIPRRTLNEKMRRLKIEKHEY